ncbi:toxin-antitoxin system YwqK family antitoxin [Leptospira sp. GIMC2001]|uniref:toxin-antitoxin system YwqK family antitoxin n=1 Tax=Leptospira sp. GIMC2001 TaxID=1513297 RepID=UPI002349A52B|nr:hypothetical protein [Leptospira sp. GIMC2001]WCL48707.1 hypothetical protein O4O04_15555 [Leptospira sp. GIMC2001]
MKRKLVLLSIFSITISFFLSCRSEGIPAGVPENANYDRKTNVFSIKRDGYMFQYYKTGELYSKCKVNENGALDGLCENFLKDNQIRISWGNFQNGQRHGTWTWTFPDGSNYVVQNFTYGKKREFWIPVEIWGNEDGEYMRFYPTGKIEEKGFYDSGYKSGSWQKFYNDGKLEYRGSYLKGKKVGGWEYFYPQGSQEAMEEYDSTGKLILRYTYYPNGNLWCKIRPEKLQECFEP